ncbi:sugar transferase [Parafrigoribacterium soli]|uniref:sugar transferase n=1 Tax=Parafrigoribacterium soli TaxID=3144663 RepID=UPI0032ED58C4
MNDLALYPPDPRNLRSPRSRMLEHGFLTRHHPGALPQSGLPWAKTYCAKLRLTDTLILSVTVGLAFCGHLGSLRAASMETSGSVARSALLALVIVAVWTVCLATFRTRDLTVIGGGVGEYKRVVNASTAVFGPIAIILLIAEVDSARWYFALSFPFGIVCLLLSRWLWRHWLIRQRELGHFLWRVVVVGTRVDVENAVRQIGSNPGGPYTVIGAVIEDSDTDRDDGPLSDIRVMRDLNRVAEYAGFIGADGVVVVGQPTGRSAFIHDLAWQLEGKTIELILATSLANIAGPRIHFRPVDGLPLMHVEIPQFEGGKHLLKRAMDIVAASLALVLLMPLFIAIAFLIRADSEGSVLFAQERVGRGGRSFRMFKFRSMVSDAAERLDEMTGANDGNGVLFKLRDDPRVTRIGRTLRKYSLDELPQFWNVLMGDMSLVGPRPPLPVEVSGYEDHVRRRLFIKPGLTGMWQINGRSDLSWEESVRLDLYYVENWSVIGDLRIMWRTFRVLIEPVGAY